MSDSRPMHGPDHARTMHGPCTRRLVVALWCCAKGGEGDGEGGMGAGDKDMITVAKALGHDIDMSTEGQEQGRSNVK